MKPPWECPRDGCSHPVWGCPRAGPVAVDNYPPPVAREFPSSGLGGTLAIHQLSCRRCPARLCSGALALMHVAGWPDPALGPATLRVESTRVVQTIQRRVHPADFPQPARAGGQMRSRLALSRSLVFHRSGLRRGRRLLCPLLTSADRSARLAPCPVGVGILTIANSPADLPG